MIQFTFPTSEAAWLGVNRDMINSVEGVDDRVIYKNQVLLYDVFVHIKKSFVNPDWDFTKTCNYTPAKWTSLVNNYVDRNHLEQVAALVQHRELKKDYNYNISFWFSNKHGGGKACLLTCTFSRRYGQDIPTLTASMRSSEFYKRGMFDLLLLHRIGEYMWGEDVPFEIRLFATQMWGGADWLSLMTSVIPPEKLFKDAEEGSFASEVEKNYHKFAEVEDVNGASYHAYNRAAKVVQGKIRGQSLLAKHCIL